LIKATSVLIAAPIACLAIQHFKLSAFRNFKLWVFAAVALIPSAIWYWHAYQISQQFCPHHFFGAGGVKIMPLAWYLKIVDQIQTTALTLNLLSLGLLGLWQTRSTSSARPFHSWLAAMILFIFIVGYGNRHPWYQLPLVPIFAALGGAACAFLANKMARPVARISLAIVIIVFFVPAVFLNARKLYEPTQAAMRNAGLALKNISPPNALVIAADNGDPTIFYYAERKGWHFTEKDGIFYGEPRDSAQAIVDLERLRKRGANFLVFSSDTSWWLDYYQEFRQYVASNSRLVEETPEFKIYQFNPVSE
jgi:hypothetical protein